MTKELLFTVHGSSKDIRWDYYKGSGKGGQKRNKTENCCRCTHLPSGAVGKSEQGRSKDHNKRQAFRKMAESTEFMQWVRVESARVTGEEAKIQAKVAQALKQTTTEVKKDGKWVKVNPDTLTDKPGGVRVSDI